MESRVETLTKFPRFWVSGQTTASMGTIRADYGELVMNT
jgi:hypothetical protein